MNRAEEDALVLEAINGATSRNDVDGVEAIRLAIRAAVAHERERAAKCAENEKTSPKWTFGMEGESYNKACDDCAAAIRRGE